MAFNHRKMLVCFLPVKDIRSTIVFPCFRNSPPPPPPPPPPQSELSLLLPTSICVAGSILLFLFLVVFLYLYITQPRRISATTVAPGDTNRWADEDESESDFSGFHHVWRIPTAGLHRSEINSITVVGFKKGEGIIDGTECSVCLNEFEEDESLRLLPKCSHAFHMNCIDTWLLSHKNCPLCRAPVLLHTEPPRQETETNHRQDSQSSNDISGGQDSSVSRNANPLPRAHSDLANHCGSGRVVNVRRSHSIGGSSSLCNGDDIGTTSRRQFCTSFSANFFSSSRTRRTRNQEPVLPNRMPSESSYTG